MFFFIDILDIILNIVIIWFVFFVAAAKGSFECPDCLKTFTRHDNLLKHLRLNRCTQGSTGSKKKGQKQKRYSAADKELIAERVRDGESLAAISKGLDIPESTIRFWGKKSTTAVPPPPPEENAKLLLPHYTAKKNPAVVAIASRENSPVLEILAAVSSEYDDTDDDDSLPAKSQWFASIQDKATVICESSSEYEEQAMTTSEYDSDDVLPLATLQRFAAVAKVVANSKAKNATIHLAIEPNLRNANH